MKTESYWGPNHTWRVLLASSHWSKYTLCVCFQCTVHVFPCFTASRVSTYSNTDLPLCRLEFCACHSFLALCLVSVIILASALCLQHDSCLTEARRHPEGCRCGRICIVLDELEFRLCVKITIGHPFTLKSGVQTFSEDDGRI